MLNMKINFNDLSLKIVIVAILALISIFISFYFQVILNINIVFSHIFYIPIILACFWWNYRGIIVPAILSIFLIIFSFFLHGSPLSMNIIENTLRSFIFIVVGIIVAFLSKHLAKEEDLKKANDRLSFYRSLFVHDMNNILQGISSSAELYSIYKERADKLNDLNELIEIIQEQSFKGYNLVSNIRKLSELEEENYELEEINLYSILNEAINFIKKGFKDKFIKVEINPERSECMVKANDLLFDVFQNILINAVKYNDNQFKEILIKISELQMNGTDYIKIEFLDNGIGISDELKTIIFQKGYKKQKHSKGMGFGLSLVKKILKSYNGKIWVENKVKGDYSKGSNFIVLIPKINGCGI